VGVSAIVWGMEKLKGVVSLVSNSPGLATGYGVQAGLLVEKMKQHGLHVAVLSNYGTEGHMGKHRTKFGEVRSTLKG